MEQIDLLNIPSAAGEEPAKSWDSKGDMKEVLLLSFIDTLAQFAEASRTVWARCPCIATWCATLQEGWGESHDRKFAYDVLNIIQRTLKPFYGYIKEHNDEFIVEGESNAAFESLNLRGKWEAAPAAVKEVVWMYAERIAQFANGFTVCTKLPPRMFDTIEEMAHEISGKIQAGEFDMASIQSTEGIGNLGKGVLARLSEADQKSFADSLASEDSLEDVLDLFMGLVRQMSASN